MMLENFMDSEGVIAKHLVETGAYSDLAKPVILTSGQLGIYYINTEELLQDNGGWKKYGDDSRAMVAHTIAMAEEHPTFGEVVDIVSDEARRILESSGSDKEIAISGGQRRDWIFSGPVANALSVHAIDLYKDGRIKDFSAFEYEGDHEIGWKNSLRNWKCLHIVDLLTEGSSCYRVEDGEEKGWIPEIRKRGGEISDLMTIVTRNQGGEEMLAAQGVDVHSFVSIDEDFLGRHSQQPAIAVAYQRDPEVWTRGYLEVHGALDLVETFDPDGGKVERAMKFIDRYGRVLQDSGKFNELDAEVRKRYRVQLK